MRLPNGFGSVHKLNGNRRKPYRARITIGWNVTKDNNKTQQYQTIGYYATKQEGLMALANFHKTPTCFNNEITFEQLYQLWSKEHYQKIVPSSIRIWKAAYHHSSYLYPKKLNDIKVSDLEFAINNAKVGSPTKVRMKSLYHMMYQYAIKHEMTDKNYAVYCETPKVETHMRRVPFGEEEIERLWKHIDMPFVDMILINIYSGLRPRELVELKNENIDLKKSIMRGGLKTDAGKNRVIPIHPIIHSLVANRYHVQNERLFVKDNGGNMTYDSYSRQFRKVMEKLGMKHRPHDARHTFISKAKKYKVDEYVIKLVVGHKITDITENVYTHRTQQDINREIHKIKK